MRVRDIPLVVVLSVVLISCAQQQPELIAEVSVGESASKYGVLDMKVLENTKKHIKAGDALYLPAYEELLEEAEMALGLAAPSVMNKTNLPPSGDKHDYMSMGPYWWPDPDSPDGLPYIRKDGVVNPEREAYDKVPGALMSQAVMALSLSYYLTDDDRYADKASHLLHTWFLDDSTKMNPHLEFGQFIPGRGNGRSVGIIESRNFVFLTDYEQLLLSSPSWTESDQQGLRTWMKDFLSWLLTSELGQEEHSRGNNHGSWCDYQILALSQYCGQPELAQPIIAELGAKRFYSQIANDGSQPEELTRTRSFSYSVFNLEALTKIMRLTDNQTGNSEEYEKYLAQLKIAVNFLTPYIQSTEDWPYKQIKGFDGSLEKLIPILTYLDARMEIGPDKENLATLLKNYPESRFTLTTHVTTTVGSLNSASD